MRQKIGLISGEQDANASAILVNSISKIAAKYDYDLYIFANYGTYDHNVILYAEGEMSVYKIPVLDSFAGFIIDETLFSYAKPDAFLMHPAPVNRGIELMPELMDSGVSMIDKQVTNGVAVRMAVLALLQEGRA